MFPCSSIHCLDRQTDKDGCRSIHVVLHPVLAFLHDPRLCPILTTAPPLPLPSPRQNVTEWETYVDAVVSHYLPRYNITYYQVWNEPTTQAGF
jgi:hypothetical protein